MISQVKLLAPADQTNRIKKHLKIAPASLFSGSDLRVCRSCLFRGRESGGVVHTTHPQSCLLITLVHVMHLFWLSWWYVTWNAGVWYDWMGGNVGREDPKLEQAQGQWDCCLQRILCREVGSSRDSLSSPRMYLWIAGNKDWILYHHDSYSSDMRQSSDQPFPNRQLQPPDPGPRISTVNTAACRPAVPTRPVCRPY